MIIENKFDIYYGITGNFYIVSDEKVILESICNRLEKATSAIKWHDKHQCYVVRFKSKRHKTRIREQFPQHFKQWQK